ncbi:MAG: T9SS type A sorting domain-containing protein [Calditrichaeota bacterium]|nr:T9SS type A sorting domain-containing protein [Calditrichota bacterium]
MSVPVKNNPQFSILTIIVFLLVLMLSSGLIADQLNVNLTVSEPEEEYFEPGDDLTITLNITNDNDQFLRVDQYRDNGLLQVMVWVSGPRQNFLIVEPYLNLRILNQNQGYSPGDYFNPVNGEMTINLPDDLEEDGTYTALIHVRRRVGNRTYILYPYIDFQVGQTEQTFTQSLSYLTCNRPGCHDNISLHGTSDTTNCAICHAYDYEISPWDVVMHEWGPHQNHNVDETCNTCHRANAGVGNYGVNACSSCHEMRAACRNYPEEQCVGCHGDEAYQAHDEFVPRVPRDFELLEPDDDVVLDSLTVELSWEETSDPDEEDIITYEVRLALDRRFRDKVIYNAGENTSIIISNLEDNTDYWWEVKAVDLNTFGTFCEDSRYFFTSMPVEPTPFILHEPADGDTIGEDGSYETEFIWQLSEEPNPNDELHYAVHVYLVGDPDPKTLIYNVSPDTIITLNPVDSLDLEFWDEPIAVEWWVVAHSGEDTLECEERFSFWLFPNPNHVGENLHEVPLDYYIKDAYPNPFNSSQSIEFGLPSSGYVRIAVYDLSGRKVSTIANGEFSSGRHQLSFDAAVLSGGIYFVRYNLDNQLMDTQKVLLIR